MKNKILVPLLTLFLTFGFISSAYSQQRQGLDYKKFGRIATVVVTEDYPGQQVVDYKYQGRDHTTDNKVVDTFRFRVMVNAQEQFVTVKVTHDNKAGKDLNISVVEEK